MESRCESVEWPDLQGRYCTVTRMHECLGTYLGTVLLAGVNALIHTMPGKWEYLDVLYLFYTNKLYLSYQPVFPRGMLFI